MTQTTTAERDWWLTGDTTQFRPIFADVLEWSRQQPQKQALIFGSRTWTYAELGTEIDRFARALLAHGITPGDRVAMMSTPRPEFLISYLAATSIGAIWQGLNPKYTERELLHIVGDSAPEILFVLGPEEEEGLLERLTSTVSHIGLASPIVAFADTEVRGDLDAEGQASGQQTMIVSFLESADSVSEDRLDHARSEVTVEQPSILVYTSGTTGAPKGALVRHSGLSRLAHIQSRRWGVDHPRIIINQPINHIGCVGDLCSVSLHAGGTLIFTDSFDPGLTLQLIETHEVSTLFQIPAQLQMIVAHGDFTSTDLSSLSAVGWGGGTLSEKLINEFRSRGIDVQNTYGLTEVTSSVTYSRPGATNEELNTSVGEPDPELQLRFLTKDGEWGSTNGPGEVCVKHPTVMCGYLNLEEKTAEAFTPDGWLRTGDIGELDADGNLHLIGRTHEMFKSGGYNVYPREIEAVLEALPGVAAAAIVPRPDEKFGEVGVAFVEGAANLDADALRAAARAELANFKVPKEIHLGALPHLPNHKIDKQLLRSRATRESLNGTFRTENTSWPN